jgi:hypothetical protein
MGPRVPLNKPSEVWEPLPWVCPIQCEVWLQVGTPRIPADREAPRKGEWQRGSQRNRREALKLSSPTHFSKPRWWSESVSAVRHLNCLTMRSHILEVSLLWILNWCCQSRKVIIKPLKVARQQANSALQKRLQDGRGGWMGADDQKPWVKSRLYRHLPPPSILAQQTPIAPRNS